MFLEKFIFEFLFGYILQALTFVLGIYAFCGEPLNVKKYCVTSFIFMLSSYTLRMLPISFGVHTLLNILVLFILSITYLKTSLTSALKATLVLTLVLLANEMAIVLIMIACFGQEKFEVLMADPVSKAVLGLPAGVTFALVILGCYLISVKKRKVKARG